MTTGETSKRTALKAGIWTLIGLITMSLVGYVATGSFAVGGGMAVVNASLGMAMYVGYERLWNRIAWGRIAHD